ncbi:DUF5700 domain-containing putative Zn-dependent protease [Salmonirosea aquatica]|uniref:DUF2268 domain-containing protein n=1 Tax=Salmonirosea aquatica TaxID=2654236 RepID=A0A7C9FZ89_9BACT|nr:hypothetical protein [Cytophagaceae bacterium SJW1-29]
MKALLPVLFWCMSVTHVIAQQIQFNLDLSNPHTTLKLLQADRLDDAGIRGLMALPTTPKLLRKLNIDSLDMVSALKKAKAGEKPNAKEARLQYDMIVQNLDSMAVFIKTVEANKDRLSRDLQASLGPYFPPETKLTVNIYAMLGGWATGYTFGERDEFFISLQKLQLDYNVLYSIAEHELFHNAQSAYFTDNSFQERLDSLGLSADLTVLGMLENLWSEGSASYIANPDKYEQTKGIVASFRPFQENEQRMGQAYYLFDHLLVDAYHNPERDFDRLYGVFFSSNWDEVGYYMGYQMLNRLSKGKSEAEKAAMIQRYLKANPLTFMRDYIALTRVPENNYYQFSKEFERIVERLALMAGL